MFKTQKKLDSLESKIEILKVNMLNFIDLFCELSEKHNRLLKHLRLEDVDIEKGKEIRKIK